MNTSFKHTAAMLLTCLLSTSVWADRVKDLATVAAQRSNQLIGFGLVVGLQGTGDGVDVNFTAQSMKTLLYRLGVAVEGPLADFETAASTGKVFFCACKQTKNAPLCDGAHKALPPG